MADMTERQAKEMGNVHTNRREFTGKDRGPIQYQDVDNMTDEQIDDELRTYEPELRHILDVDVHKPPETEQ